MESMRTSMRAPTGAVRPTFTPRTGAALVGDKQTLLGNATAMPSTLHSLYPPSSTSMPTLDHQPTVAPPQAPSSAAASLPAAYPRNGSFDDIMAYFRAHADGLPGAPQEGYAARLALALGGECVRELDALRPPDSSMLRRSLVDSRPDRQLAPAFETAALATAPTSFTSLVDLAEKMIDALPMDRQRPMEKAYAAIRLQLGLIGCLGQTRKASWTGVNEGENDFLFAPLENLRRDAQSETVAQVAVLAVRQDFTHIREVAQKFDREIGLDIDRGHDEVSQPAIVRDEAEGFVSIGGVKVAIRR